jgi:DNA-binding GntR family transcriptional regulator
MCYNEAMARDLARIKALPPLGELRNRADLVAESLRKAILAGQLRPDEVLSERGIAESLGISKTPVREALISLSRRGLVSPAPRSAMVVRRLSMTDVRHIYEERALLEPWAIADAVARGSRDFGAAETALAEARELIRENDLLAVAAVNRDFHRGMYSACENTFVSQALDELQDLTILAITGTLWGVSPTWSEEADEHEAILRAAQQGDADRAAELAREHISASIRRIAARENEDAGSPAGTESELSGQDAVRRNSSSVSSLGG